MRRDARLKPILMGVALVLVVGYALSVTEMGAYVIDNATALFHSDFALLLIGGAGLLAAAGGIAFLVLRGRIGAAGDEKEAPPVNLESLANRRTLLARLDAEIAEHAKSGRQVALHVIDIDRFHVVNQLRGEQEADEFLRLVTERLLLLTNKKERLARIGDDEFAVLQTEIGGSRHAEIFARRIQDTLKDACAQVPRNARPGASVGTAVAPDHGTDASRIMHAASLALRAAKNAGGDALRVYSRDMEMVAEARQQMEKAIGDGLHQGWFELRYQPQYDLRSRRLTGFEALVRLNHPELGELQPADFLPVADESGLIQPLGEWIVRDAFATAVEWPKQLSLSLNVSLAQFLHGDIANVVQHACANVGLQPSRLRVEVSEAALLTSSAAVDEQLRRLKSRGVSIVLDDFGIDNSRLRLLSAPVCDAVKLDRSLVQNVGQEPRVDVLLRALIRTAQSFNLDILAEGVERAEQAHFLMSHECEKVQGFLFGRPARKSELAAIIAKDLRNAIDDGRRDPKTSVAA